MSEKLSSLRQCINESLKYLDLHIEQLLQKDREDVTLVDRAFRNEEQILWAKKRQAEEINQLQSKNHNDEMFCGLHGFQLFTEFIDEDSFDFQHIEAKFKGEMIQYGGIPPEIKQCYRFTIASSEFQQTILEDNDNQKWKENMYMYGTFQKIHLNIKNNEEIYLFSDPMLAINHFLESQNEDEFENNYMSDFRSQLEFDENFSSDSVDKNLPKFFPIFQCRVSLENSLKIKMRQPPRYVVNETLLTRSCKRNNHILAHHITALQF